MATPVDIDEELKSRIQALAEARHRSSHWIMREAIRVYVEREERREVLKRDLIFAWEAYQKNVVHLTLEEADAWLEKIEAGEDVELPRCPI